MLVNSQLIRAERLKRAWSQEHLAHVSGLGLRTVQRIESGGNASLETMKALAAVLELPVEALLVEASASSVTPPPSSRFRLFKPWRAFAAGCVTTLMTLGGFFSVQGVLAEQIALEFAVTLNDELISKSRMTSEDGTAAVVEITDLLRVSLTPSIRDDGQVLLQADIYLFQDGDYKLFAKPTILALDGKPAQIRVGKDATLLLFDVTPTIE